MFICGLRSISDDWPGDLSDKHPLKCEKRPPKSLKNEMFICGLHSISDDQPGDLSDKH